MCGIIGYVGHRDATPLLLKCLKNLEYRGYDSSGVGVISQEKADFAVRKTHGKIQNLLDLIAAQGIPKAHIGISHTRWATHGKPNRTNAHPHMDSLKKILIVHNGIIENYEPLKAMLQKEGFKFVSETDTEVIANLISHYYEGDLLLAVRQAVKEMQGSFAIGVLSSDHPDTLIATRLGSPLIIGVGHNENFIASDVPAILDQTRRVIYLKDQEIAVLKNNQVKVFDKNGRSVPHKVDKVMFSIGSAQKEGFPHFMLKEIHEQPKIIEQILSNRLKKDEVFLEGLKLTEKQLKGIRNIIVVACGTAYHAGMVGRYVIEHFSGIPVSVDLASEFRYRSPIVDKKTLVVAISQSGETADTLAAVREAKGKGARVAAICNVVGSSLVRESHDVLYTHAGPEIGVASTKAYTAQLCMLYLLALRLGKLRGKLQKDFLADFLHDLRRIPAIYREVLKDKDATARIAQAHSHFGCFLFLGRNINFPSALEGALKLKEISYIPAEGYAAGEMKHGPIALIDEYRAVVCIAPQSDIYDKMISNMEEIRSRRGKVIAIATAGDNDIKHHAHSVISIPRTNKLLTALVVPLPLQLLAYYIAVKRGCDVDQPRNLAKSVTVE